MGELTEQLSKEETGMGFDLTGLKARSEKGRYFGTNVWTWHPIAEYVLERCPAKAPLAARIMLIAVGFRAMASPGRAP